jgi:hypothetical protein
MYALVGINAQYPVSLALRIRVVAQIAFAKATRRLKSPMKRCNPILLFKKFGSAIRRASIDDNNVINMIQQWIQAGLQTTNLILYNHTQGKHKHEKGRPGTPL